MTVGDLEVSTVDLDTGARVYVSNTPTLQETEIRTAAEARVLARELARVFGFKVTFPKEG